MGANFIHAYERNARIIIWNLNFHRRNSKFSFLPMEDYDFTRETKVFHIIVRGCKSRKLNALGHPRTFFSFFSLLTFNSAWIESSLLRENTPCVRQNTLSSFDRVHRENTIPLVSVPFIYRSPHSLLGEINTMGRLIARGTIKLLGDCRFNYARIIFSRCQNWRVPGGKDHSCAELRKEVFGIWNIKSL